MQLKFKPYSRYRLWLRWVSVWLGLCWLVPSWAQQTETAVLRQWAVEAGSSISFTGLNGHLSGAFRLGPHEIHIGPKWVISDTYLLQRGPWGLELGYRWHLLSRANRSAFASFSYQAAFLGLADPDRRTTVHEVHASYGFQWRLARRFYLGNALGLGGVVERSRNLSNNQNFRINGFSVLLKLWGKYTF